MAECRDCRYIVRQVRWACCEHPDGVNPDGAPCLIFVRRKDALRQRGQRTLFKEGKP